MIIDTWGVYGAYLHYGIVILMVGLAFIMFYYLWSQGRLDMDESPKMQMMEEKDSE